MLIGLSAKMGTGKTTLSNIIIQELSSVSEVIQEKIAKDLYDLQDHIYKTCNLTLEGEKDRDLLIAIGMWGRSKSPSLWTDLCFNRVQQHLEQGKIVIIDDIRFPEEADKVTELGGFLVRIDGKQRGPNLTPHQMNSASETALDNYNFKHRINNNGTPEETYAMFMQELSRFYTT